MLKTILFHIPHTRYFFVHAQKKDIPKRYKDNPIGLLFEYHNCKRKFKVHLHAQLLIGMCMDNRNNLHIPDNFAFIIRSSGANLRNIEFNISYAIAIGQVRHMVLIGHNNCGMVSLISRKKEFIKGLIDIAGWRREAAEAHFIKSACSYEIDNELDFIVNEAKRLSMKYPKIKFTPLYYRIEDSLLCCID